MGRELEYWNTPPERDVLLCHSRMCLKHAIYKGAYKWRRSGVDSPDRGYTCNHHSSDFYAQHHHFIDGLFNCRNLFMKRLGLTFYRQHRPIELDAESSELNIHQVEFTTHHLLDVTRVVFDVPEFRVKALICLTRLAVTVGLPRLDRPERRDNLPKLLAYIPFPHHWTLPGSPTPINEGRFRHTSPFFR